MLVEKAARSAAATSEIILNVLVKQPGKVVKSAEEEKQ